MRCESSCPNCVNFVWERPAPEARRRNFLCVRIIRRWDPGNMGYTIFPPKDGRKLLKRTRLPAIVTIPNKPLFRGLFRQFCYRELTDYYSVHSGIRIGSKRTHLPPIPCIGHCRTTSCEYRQDSRNQKLQIFVTSKHDWCKPFGKRDRCHTFSGPTDCYLVPWTLGTLSTNKIDDADVRK